MKRILLLLFSFAVGAILLYFSRFWVFDLWPRAGLFGWDVLRPQGRILARLLRGTPFAPFELLIWGVAVFMILTYLQRIIDFVAGLWAPSGE